MPNEAQVEKRRIEVVWNDLKFEFCWRVGTPPDLLASRLSRMLDPLADSTKLELCDSEGTILPLCDDILSGYSLFARFGYSDSSAEGLHHSLLLSSSSLLLPRPDFPPPLTDAGTGEDNEETELALIGEKPVRVRVYLRDSSPPH